MNLRFLIAMVLIFLIVAVWQYYLEKTGKIKRPVTKVERKIKREELKEEEKIVEKKVMEKIEAKEDTIETPLYTAVITRKGAGLKSFILKKFKDYKGNFVNLIKSGVALTDKQTKDKKFELVLKKDKKYIYETRAGDKIYRKIYTFNDTDYIVDLKIEVEGKNVYDIYWDCGLAKTEKTPEEFRYFSAVIGIGKGAEQISLSKLDTSFSKEYGKINFVGIKNKYFLSAIIPENPVSYYGFKRFTKRFVGGGCRCAPEPRLRPIDYKMAYHVAIEGEGIFNYKIYVGPLDYEQLKKYKIGLEHACYFGWKWIRPIARGILKFLIFLHKGIKNYGVVLIVFAFIMNLVFIPLTLYSYRSMKKMQQLQPQIIALQKKYAKDPRKLNEEVMNLYRKYGVSPFSGCLPLLIQLPIFFALYAVLESTLELRGAVFIKGWINDLSQPDPYFALPIIMGILMFLQQKLQGTPQDPNQRLFSLMMPILITIIFFRFPAGIVLYWTAYNVFSIVENIFAFKKFKT